MTQRIDKDSLKLDQPRRTPGHPTKSHVVKTKIDGKEKILRFGEQGAKTAGKPKAGESQAMKDKRASFKSRHAKNIAKGKSSPAYWADKVKWAEGGEVKGMAVGGGWGAMAEANKAAASKEREKQARAEAAASMRSAGVTGIGGGTRPADREGPLTARTMASDLGNMVELDRDIFASDDDDISPQMRAYLSSPIGAVAEPPVGPMPAPSVITSRPLGDNVAPLSQLSQVSQPSQPIGFFETIRNIPGAIGRDLKMGWQAGMFRGRDTQRENLMEAGYTPAEINDYFARTDATLARNAAEAAMRGNRDDATMPTNYADLARAFAQEYNVVGRNRTQLMPLLETFLRSRGILDPSTYSENIFNTLSIPMQEGGSVDLARLARRYADGGAVDEDEPSFFSLSGQERRRALDALDERIGEGLRYYLGPTPIPQLLGFAAEMTPTRAVERASEASQRMMQPGLTPLQRAAAGAEMLGDVASVVAPIAMGARGAMPMAEAVQEAFMGLSVPARAAAQDVVDRLNQPGPMPRTLYSTPLMRAEEEAAGIRAYHGSPHTFERFDMSKIGTGEGAQAYGRGLYFAEKEGVARGYRDALSARDSGVQITSRTAKEEKVEKALRKYLEDAGWDDITGLRSAIRSHAYQMDDPDMEDVFEAMVDRGQIKVLGPLNPGRLYEVNIAARPEDFIDYDKPLSEQSDLVKKYFGYVPKPTAEEERAAIDAMLGIGDPASRPVDIEDMYRRESAANEAERRFQRQVQGGGIDEAARIALSEAGVPGVRYLDAGSRRDGDGTRNYVVFDDRLISIVRMYGIAGAAALLGVSVADVEQAMAEGMAAEGMDKAKGGVVRFDRGGSVDLERLLERYGPRGNVDRSTGRLPPSAPEYVPPEVFDERMAPSPGTAEDIRSRALANRRAMREADTFGDTAAAMASGPWQEAARRMSIAGSREGVAGFLPETQNPYLRALQSATGYLGDVGLAGLSAAEAGIAGGAGLIAEALPQGLYESIPGAPRRSPDEFERKFAEELAYGIPESIAGLSGARSVTMLDDLADALAASPAATTRALDQMLESYDPNVLGSNLGNIGGGRRPLANFQDQPLAQPRRITPRDLEGARIIPTVADLTRAGGYYRGIDASEIDVPEPMMGGPGYPLLPSSQQAGLAWAVQGKALGTKKAGKGADLIAVTAMNPTSHKSNISFINSLIKTTEAYVRDGRLRPETLRELDERVRAAAGGGDPALARLDRFPGFESPNVQEWINNASFQERSRIADIIGSKGMQDLGLPNINRVLQETVDPRYAGANPRDTLLFIEPDFTAPPVDLMAEGYPVHPSYRYGIRGRVFGALDQNVSTFEMFPDFWGEKNIRAFGTPFEKGGRRAFDLSLPLQEVTGKQVEDLERVLRTRANASGPTIEAASRLSPIDTRIVVNSMLDKWKPSTQTVKSGGVSPQAFVDAINNSKYKPALTNYTAADVKAGAKSGNFTVFQLGDDDVFFGIDAKPDYSWAGVEMMPEDKALVGVVSNAPGSKGTAVPSVMAKALEEGVTILDAFAVPSARHPEGFLPKYYGKFGFQEVGRVPFDPDLYIADHGERAYKDLRAAWKSDGWDESMGMPPVVVMRWSGSDADRTATAAGIRGAGAPSHRATTEGFVPEAEGSVGLGADRPVSEEPTSDGRRAARGAGADNRLRIASGAGEVAEGLLGLTPRELQNRGISREQIKELSRKYDFDLPPDFARGGNVRSRVKGYAAGGMVSQYNPAMIDQIVNRVRGAGRG